MHDHMNACCVNLLQAKKLVFSFALTDLQHGSGENLQEMDISALHEVAQEEIAEAPKVMVVEDVSANINVHVH